MKGVIIVTTTVVILLILIIGIWYVWATPTPASAPVAVKPVPVAAPTSAPIKPKTEKIQDCGYLSGRRGWYDVQGQGARNDYCRFVGPWPAGGAPNIWFSCQLAGADNPISMPGAIKVDPNSPHDEHDGSRGCPAGGGNDPLM